MTGDMALDCLAWISGCLKGWTAAIGGIAVFPLKHRIQDPKKLPSEVSAGNGLGYKACPS